MGQVWLNSLYVGYFASNCGIVNGCDEDFGHKSVCQRQNMAKLLNQTVDLMFFL